MRIFTTILVAAAIGIAVGGAMAYIDVRTDPDGAPRPVIEAPKAPGGVGEIVRPTSGPRVEVDQPTFSFGSMQRGTTKSHEYGFRNLGTAPLTLEVIAKSCKCTLADIKDTTVPPGGSTVVRLEWAAKTEAGPFRHGATIKTNDPLRPEVDLSIEGKVVEASGVSPRDFFLDKILLEESKSAHVYVMAMLQDDLKVSDPEISPPEVRDKFDVKIEPATHEEMPSPDARQGVKITVTTKPGLAIGRLNYWLSLRTNLPEAGKLEIPITGRVVGDISIRGNGWNDEQGALMMGKIESQEGRQGRVNVVIRGSEAANVKFEVQSVDPPELHVSIGKPQKLSPMLVHVPIEIEVPAGTRPMVRLQTPQGDEARIVLSTTHPQIKEVVIPLRFTVER